MVKRHDSKTNDNGYRIWVTLHGDLAIFVRSRFRREFEVESKTRRRKGRRKKRGFSKIRNILHDRSHCVVRTHPACTGMMVVLRAENAPNAVIEHTTYALRVRVNTILTINNFTIHVGARRKQKQKVRENPYSGSHVAMVPRVFSG